jgi:ADP-ribose pyrophosphatase YjhB (NUDIX family)
MSKEYIKVKALCLIVNDNKETLLSVDYDNVKKEYYYRPLGGHVDFNEKTVDTVKREFREEIGAEIMNLKLLSVTENIFHCDGIPGHEIVFTYTGEFADKSLYKTKEFSFTYGSDAHEVKVFWVKIEDCLNGRYVFVPEGLNEKLQQFI